MDNLQKEIELKKLEIEKLKVKEGLTRTILILILTVGAGIGTLAKIIDIPNIWYEVVFVFLLVVFLTFSIYFLIIVITIRTKLKELEKWKP
ncbi:hypothetical protein [Persephonella sp.]|uniref:hypothetical protein n=1 Tax=Persephonella sp. TaxID=2060922 RepID=UPI0026305E6C|nr:hypothetical protein [Persephonella sp.]